MCVPVCTWSPIFNSDIVTDFPFSRLTVASAGKHDDDDGGGGGGGGGLVGIGISLHMQQLLESVGH